MEPQKRGKYSKLLEPEETEAVSRVFAEKTDTEHAVLLQQMWRWTVYSELLWEVAYACESVSR